MDLVLTVVLALFGGMGGTSLWEGLVGPWRTNRRVARAIAAETSMNLQLMAGHLAAASPKRIPSDFAVSRMAFDALAPEIGQLPPQAFREVMLLYNRIDYLNKLVGLFGEILDRYRAETDPTIKKEIKKELDSAIEAFYRLLDAGIDNGNQLQKHLYQIGESWRFRREPFQTESMGEIDNRVRELLARRRRNLERGGEEGS